MATTTKEQRGYALSRVREMFNELDSKLEAKVLPTDEEVLEMHKQGKLVPVETEPHRRYDELEISNTDDLDNGPTYYVTKAFKLPDSMVRDMRATRQQRMLARHNAKKRKDELIQRIMLKASPEELLQIIEEARQYTRDAAKEVESGDES